MDSSGNCVIEIYNSIYDQSIGISLVEYHNKVIQNTPDGGSYQWV